MRVECVVYAFLLLVIGVCAGSSVRPMLYPEMPAVPDDFNITGLSFHCGEQLVDISITRPEDYQQMFHAWGRSMGDTGLFYECTQIPEAEYCLAMLDVDVSQNDTSFTCASNIPQCNLGICVPDKCNQHDINLILSTVRSQLGTYLNGSNVEHNFSWIANCQVDTSIPGNPLSIVGIISLGSIIATAIGATLLHMLIKGNLKSLYERVPVKSFPTHEEETRKETLTNLEFKNVVGGPSDLALKPLHEPASAISEDKDPEKEISDVFGEDKERIGDDEEEELSFIMRENPALLINEDDGEMVEQKLLEEEEERSASLTIQESKPEEQEEQETNASKVLPKPVHSIADCFSVPSNFRRLLNPIPGEFGSLNGLRFFSMMWVIWGHTLFFWAQIGTANLGYAYGEFIHQFYIQAAMSGIFAVDSFFFLSGFLGSYFLYERLMDGKRMEWFLIYFHRFWRILPVYTFIMLIYVTMLPVLGDGPFWYKLVHIVENTSPNCWANLIFINNIYPTNSADQCMGWGWFLAVDMQFFLVSPLLIYIYYKYPKIGLGLLGIWLLQDLTTATTLSAVRGYSPSIIKMQPHFFEQFYQRPYCRASPYIVGLLSGYLYSYLRRNKPNFRIPMPLVHTGYAISLSTIAVIVYSIYWDDQWNQFENSLYLGFSRFAWGLCIAYLNFTMFLGYGGLLRKFFFARVWEPMAKLTYGAYLSHPIFMWLFYFNQWQYIVIQNRNMWYYYIAHATCAFSFAVIAYLLIEKPFMNLEPLLIKGFVRLVFKIRNKPVPADFK